MLPWVPSIMLTQCTESYNAHTMYSQIGWLHMKGEDFLKFSAAETYLVGSNLDF